MWVDHSCARQKSHRRGGGPSIILPSHRSLYRGEFCPYPLDTESCLISTCYQGYSNPYFPELMSPAAAKAVRFSGPVLHSMDFASRIDDLLSITAPTGPNAAPPAPVVIVGGGKSAQEWAQTCAHPGSRLMVALALLPCLQEKVGLLRWYSKPPTLP